MDARVAITLVVMLMVHRAKMPVVMLAYAAPASALPGLHAVHLPLSDERVYEGLVADVRSNCDMLWSLPGEYGFNILHDMRPVAELGAYQIRVSPGRAKPWVEQPKL